MSGLSDMTEPVGLGGFRQSQGGHKLKNSLSGDSLSGDTEKPA